jgi:hypothetical protein
MASDGLVLLAAELSAMSPRARRSILRSLTPAERLSLTRAAEDVGASDQVTSTDGDGPGLFSPWLAARIHQARAAGEGSELADRMTVASRQLLLRLADSIDSRPTAQSASRDAGGRSLFDAMGGFLSPRRPRA